jgi:hypothetical protein
MQQAKVDEERSRKQLVSGRFVLGSDDWHREKPQLPQERFRFRLATGSGRASIRKKKKSNKVSPDR